MRTASGRTVRRMLRIVAVGPVARPVALLRAGGAGAAARRQLSWRLGAGDGRRRRFTGGHRAAARRLERGRHLFRQLAARVACRQPLQQPLPGVTVAGLAEAGERIQRETAGPPQRIVAVAAGRIAPRHEQVRGDGRVDVVERRLRLRVGIVEGNPRGLFERRAPRRTDPDRPPAPGQGARAPPQRQAPSPRVRTAGESVVRSPWGHAHRNWASTSSKYCLSTRTSRALPPAAPDTRPSISIMSTRRAARLNPMRRRRWRYEIDA